MTDPGQISAPRADSRTLKDCRSCSPTTRAAISVGLPSMMIFTLSPPFVPSHRIPPAGRRDAAAIFFALCAVPGRPAENQVVRGAAEQLRRQLYQRHRWDF